MMGTVVLIALSLFSFQRAPSKEVRAKLFKQVLADDAEVRDCLKEDEIAAAEKKMTIAARDLNGDGIAEYEVELPGLCACGAQNCNIYLYRRNGASYESVLEGASGLGVEVLKTSTNGFLDLQISMHDSAATQYRTRYKFDGKQYREAQSTLVNLETGESKPAYRRVQFARGSSAATVQGKASLLLPDTYLVGARAGQVMTIQLAGAQESVRFMVMESRTTTMLADNVRSWTGTLTATGDYHIIVNADENGGTYSMTISIK